MAPPPPPHLLSSWLVFLSQWSIISSPFVLSFCFTLMIIIIFYSISRNKSLRPLPPRAPGAWPLIGHVDLLTLPSEKLRAMADKYGPVFSIQLGTHEAIVISNWEIVKECFTINDKLFSNRPKSLALECVTDNEHSLNHVAYGPHWRNLRKVSAISLFSNQRVEMQNAIRTSEINVWFNHLYMLGKKEALIISGGDGPSSTTHQNQIHNEQVAGPAISMDMKLWIRDIVFNFIFEFIIGGDDQSPQNGPMKNLRKKYKKVMEETMDLAASSFAISDFIPFLKWYDQLSGLTTVLKKKAKELDSIQDMCLQEYQRRHHHHHHISRKSSNIIFDNISSIDDDRPEDDQVKPFMDYLLSTIQTSQFVGLDTDAIIKAACQDMVSAYEFPNVTLTWALYFLLKNPRVLNKARKELDENVGRDRQVDESDLKKLSYVQAITKESMRLYDPGASVLRVTTEDCEVGGYHVKAGTTLVVNMWKVHRDTNVWPDPFEFKPERFLAGGSNAQVDLKGQHFEFIPFGSGRRICPAVTFSLRFLHLILARLIHGFELNIPTDQTVDMSLLNIKVAPLEVAISPRLAPDAYALNGI